MLYQRDYLHLLGEVRPRAAVSQLADGSMGAPQPLDLFPARHRRAEPRGGRAMTESATLRTARSTPRTAPSARAWCAFGGWDMPIQYTSVLEEHRACRDRRRGVRRVAPRVGPRRRVPVRSTLLQWALTNDLDRIAPGRAQYTHLLDPVDAHVVDDIIVWWVADDDFVVMPNASNTERIARALGEVDGQPGWSVSIDDITHERAILAVQGPHARERLATVLPDAAAVAALRACTALEYDGLPGYAAGTGYTGEDGVELHVPVAVAAARVGRRRSTPGSPPRGSAAATPSASRPGSRCTVTSSARASRRSRPASAGWCASTRATSAAATRSAPSSDRGRGPPPRRHRRRGAPARRARVARCSSTVRAVGEVTSGNFSPMLGHGIALAFVPPAVGVGTAVAIDVRGRELPGEIVELPFWPH